MREVPSIAMDPVHPQVLQGRDPWWREALEDRLDDDARRRLERAVRSGQPVSDPELEPSSTD